MKVTQLCFAALAACLMFAGQASADIVTSDAAPTGDVLAGSLTGGSVSTLINAGATQGARGTAFTVAGPASTNFDITDFTHPSQRWGYLYLSRELHNCDLFRYSRNFYGTNYFC